MLREELNLRGSDGPDSRNDKIDGARPCSHTERPDPLAPDEFLRETIEVWQPKSERHLTPEDAREVISNASGFFSVLAEWDRNTSRATPEDEGGS